MSVLLVLHVLSAGLWAGCVAVEVVFEKMLAKVDERGLLLARLHEVVDFAVEGPAMALVLGTGLLLVVNAPWSPLLALKIAAALAALAANAYCIGLVVARRRAASSGDRGAFDLADTLQHKAGAVVVAGIVLALALGIAHAAGA